MRVGSRNPVHRLRHLLTAHDPDAQPDAVLLARFSADRDEAAFAALVRRHTNLVLGTARRVVGNPVDADDVFQAVFLTLSRKAPSVRCDGTLAPWLYRVTLRAALRLRKRARAAEPVDRSGPAVTSDPLAQMSARELCSAIDAEVNRLSARLRAVVVLCCLEGQTRDEAAAQLGWSSATVKRRLARARALLERRLSARGIALPAALGTVLLAVTPPASAERMAATVGVAVGRAVPPPRISALCGIESFPVKVWAASVVGVGVLSVGVLIGLQPPRPMTPPAPPEGAPRAERPGALAELPPDPLPAGAVARVGTSRFRHDEWLSQAAWSPDGKHIASAAGRTVIVWDAATGRELTRQVLKESEFPPADGKKRDWPAFVEGLDWSADGKSLLTVFNGLVRQWSWEGTTSQLKIVQAYSNGPGRAVMAAGFAAGGSILFAASETFVGVTDLKSKASVATLDVGGGPVGRCLASPDGHTLAVATTGDGAKVRIFDLREPGAPLKIVDGARQNLAFSADGKTFAAVRSDGQRSSAIEIWDTPTWTSRRTLAYVSDRTGEIRALALSPDGKTLVTGGADKTLRWWDTTTGKEFRREGPGWVYYNRAAFRPDGKVLMTVSHENHVRLWDVETGKQLPLTDGPGWTIAATAFTPDGRTILSVSENLVFAHDAVTGRELWRGTGHTDTAVQVVVTPDGHTVISSGNDGRIIFRDLVTGKAFRTIEAPRHAVDRIAVSPDGRTVAAIGGDAPNDAILRRWDVATGKPYPDAPLPPKGPKYVPSSIRYTPDGSGILIASGTEIQVPVFDPDRKEFRQSFGPADGGVNWADMTADGRMVAAATAGGSIILWEAATNRQRLMLKGAGYTTCLAFSPDGRILAIANDGTHRHISADKEVAQTDGRLVVRLLDAFSGKEFHRFTGHTGSVYRLAWSPDGRRLVSGSNDASALVWDVSPAIRAKLPATRLTAAAAAGAAAALAGTDAAAAYREMGRLAGDPAAAVNAIRSTLRPIAAADPALVAKFVRDLDNPQFATRERAAGELAKLGEGAEGALRKALDGKPSAEARDRIEKLLADVGSPDLRRRQGRLLELLERLGGPAARSLLAELAAGADGAWLTREATAAVGRLSPRSR